MRKNYSRRVCHALHLLLLLAFLILMSPAASVNAQGEDVNAATGPAVSPAASQAQSQPVFLPLIFGPPPNSWRLGYGAVDNPITRYAEVGSLKAGWYVDWTTRVTPVRPSYIEYVQTIRIHQKLQTSAIYKCNLYDADAYDRTKCPYAQPYDYVTLQSLGQIAEAVRANPGSLWLIGNEMDRRDWPFGGQDEMLPETYARAYHDLYFYVKGIDPRARVAIGGVIQATPLRLEYLTKVWDTYKTLYNGTEMPVDVWNVHNFILREKLGATEAGASVPPGINASQGVMYDSGLSHIDKTIFDQQIRAFRSWMKERNQQNKPLIVSEYGVLLFDFGLEDPNVLQPFMVWTFDYFLNTKDCTLGYVRDECRLVQRWNWYSLDDSITGFNIYGPFFNYSTRAITSTGVRFREYSLSKLNELGWGPWW